MKLADAEIKKAGWDVVKAKSLIFKDKREKEKFVNYCINKLKQALLFAEGKDEREK